MEKERQVKTTGGDKASLMKTKRGRIVTKAKSKAGHKAYKRNGLSKWTKAFMQARKEFGAVTGFQVLQEGYCVLQGSYAHLQELMT
eukprot:UN17624